MDAHQPPKHHGWFCSRGLHWSSPALWCWYSVATQIINEEVIPWNHCQWASNWIWNSDVLAQAWPESHSFALALGGFGLRKSWAKPKAISQAWLGLALAQAGAFVVYVQFRIFDLEIDLNVCNLYLPYSIFTLFYSFICARGVESCHNYVKSWWTAQKVSFDWNLNSNRSHRVPHHIWNSVQCEKPLWKC